MLDWRKHKIIIIQILKDIYQNPLISPWLGFKGGTAAYLFYGLPRYSVDLDFDLLDIGKKENVFVEVKKIVEKYGKIKDEMIKENTILLEISYGDQEHNIKIEISTRQLKNNFEILNYLGIPMQVMAKEDIFANKLLALTSRRKTATRDIFDVYFFLSKHWDFNRQAVIDRSGKNIKDYLAECIKFAEGVNNQNILMGLGELVDEKQKDWIKKNLKNEVLFYLKNYQTMLEE
ncbi:MAG: hypothetical protein COX31_00280 [Candidatus Moranbacteria bacterium CG23_combo_of_CG06-09_8_20_14_all_40_16]|nr:MAG: hypothetical protein COX31_00280 [Candidatus Moranbacteria bacterium CG23_combo_of_CG06-09_8_20_14_all_40_16]